MVSVYSGHSQFLLLFPLPILPPCNKLQFNHISENAHACARVKTCKFVDWCTFFMIHLVQTPEQLMLVKISYLSKRHRCVKGIFYHQYWKGDRQYLQQALFSCRIIDHKSFFFMEDTFHQWKNVSFVLSKDGLCSVMLIIKTTLFLLKQIRKCPSIFSEEQNSKTKLFHNLF